MTDNIIAEAREQVPDRWRTHELGTRDRIIRGLADALEAEHKRAEEAVWAAGIVGDVSRDALASLQDAQAERDHYRAEAESARKTGERILTDALRYRTALERIDTELRGDGRSSVLIVIAQEIIYDALNEGAADA